MVHICAVDTLTVDSRVTLNILTLGQVLFGGVAIVDGCDEFVVNIVNLALNQEAFS